MAYPTPAEIDAAVPAAGTPSRALTNAVLKGFLATGTATQLYGFSATGVPQTVTLTPMHWMPGMPIESLPDNTMWVAGFEYGTGGAYNSGFFSMAETPEGKSIPMRNSDGEMQTAPATLPAHAVALSQVEQAIGMAANFGDGVRTTTLTGLTLASTPASAADSVLSAFGKLQGQMNERPALDINGKLSPDVLPDATLVYRGGWNAEFNTPPLADGMSGVESGDFYLAIAPGVQDLGNGTEAYALYDRVYYNGVSWERAPSGNTIVSVNGQQGEVVLHGANLPIEAGSTVTIKEEIDARIPERLTATGAVTGAGQQISLVIGNIEVGIEWLNAASLRQYIKTVSGSEVIDFRRVDIWGSGAVEAQYWDGYTLTETKLITDVETYDDSNETPIHLLREGGRVWQIGAFLSGNGTRCAMWAERKA